MPDALDPATILIEILAQQGPLSDDAVIEQLQAAGVADPEDVFEHLLDEIGTAAGELLDGRWIWVPKLLDGRVFTHRLTAIEIAYDVLTVTPDLDPVTAVCETEEFAHFSDGSRAYVALPMFDLELLDERRIPLHEVDHLGVLLLAPGTLAGLGVAEGDLVGLRLTAEGLTVEPVVEIVDAGVGARLSTMLTTDDPVFFDAAVWTACVDDSALFSRALAPLSEVADGAGLPYDQERLAPAGFDFDAWRFDLGCAALARRYDIEPDDAFALYTLVKFYEQMEVLVESFGGEDRLADDEPLHDDKPGASAEPSLAELTGELGAVLADPALAEILMAETVGRGGGLAALGLFAETLERRVPRPARVACRWLGAVALERIGNIEEAERQLLAAESMDTDWGPVLFDLARFASDRGDAERGLSLLRRAGAAADDSMVALLERHRALPRPDLGRNEVCWCGSGRKYKKCHLGREQLPLAERVGWLYSKAAQHITTGGWRDLLIEVGLERTRYADDDTEVDDFVDLLVLDAVLVEGGAFADFLEVRGSLLPDDERALAEQWLLVERSVFDIVDVHRGHSITVRDVRTGDRHEVRERAGSSVLRPGQLICTRAVPAGDTMQFFGGIEPVALHEREKLIALLDAEPDAVELVAHLSRRFAPPTLVNTEGDPLAICQATVQVGDPDRIESALDDTYDRLDGEEPARWLEHVTTQGMPRIRATLELEDGTVRVETNSDQRMDRVLATLARVDPAMTVLDDVRQPMPDARVAAELASQLPAGGRALDPADPEVAAFLGQMILDYEATWLDEKIPALDGSTPRQAADDPTRRADLIKLLDTFPTGPAAAGGMDADRLRAALGLE